MRLAQELEKFGRLINFFRTLTFDQHPTPFTDPLRRIVFSRDARNFIVGARLVGRMTAYYAARSSRHFFLFFELSWEWHVNFIFVKPTTKISRWIAYSELSVDIMIRKK